MAVIRVQFIGERGRIPERATRGSAGYDIFAPARLVIPPGGDLFSLRSGLRLAMDHNTYLQLDGRSGLASRGLWVHPGIIDSDFRGEVKVLVRNHSNKEIVIEKGEAFVQAVVHWILNRSFVEDEVSEGETRRGAGGFGSTTLQKKCSHCQCEKCEKEKVSQYYFLSASPR